MSCHKFRYIPRLSGLGEAYGRSPNFSLRDLSGGEMQLTKRSRLQRLSPEFAALQDCREYFYCSLPSSYGALKFVEDVLKGYDREAYENECVSIVPFIDVKIGNPTREVYGDLYDAYTNSAAKEHRRNPQQRLKETLYSRISIAMSALRKKRNEPSLRKAGSAVKDLGCTLEFLEKHIEGQFQEGMTWDNYGEWEVDHIFPLAKLDLTNSEDFAKACHYSNLQPLWWQDNLKKSDKVLQ